MCWNALPVFAQKRAMTSQPEQEHQRPQEWNALPADQMQPQLRWNALPVFAEKCVLDAQLEWNALPADQMQTQMRWNALPVFAQKNAIAT